MALCSKVCCFCSQKQRLFEEMDRKRKEEFKLYEMRMEHEQRARLKAAEDEKQKLKLEQE